MALSLKSHHHYCCFSTKRFVPVDGREWSMPRGTPETGPLVLALPLAVSILGLTGTVTSKCHLPKFSKIVAYHLYFAVSQNLPFHNKEKWGQREVFSFPVFMTFWIFKNICMKFSFPLASRRFPFLSKQQNHREILWIQRHHLPPWRNVCGWGAFPKQASKPVCPVQLLSK